MIMNVTVIKTEEAAVLDEKADRQFFTFVRTGTGRVIRVGTGPHAFREGIKLRVRMKVNGDVFLEIRPGPLRR